MASFTFAMQFAHDAIIHIQQRIAFGEFNNQLLHRMALNQECSDPVATCVAKMAGGDVNADVKTRGRGKKPIWRTVSAMT
jgi:hypothetical protein